MNPIVQIGYNLAVNGYMITKLQLFRTNAVFGYITVWCDDGSTLTTNTMAYSEAHMRFNAALAHWKKLRD